MTQKNIKKNQIIFFLALALFAVASYLQHFESNVSTYMTTMFAINYDFGFIPRGFLGSALQFLSDLLPGDFYTYSGIYSLSKLITAIFYLLLFVFFFICLKRSSENQKKNQQYLIIFLSLFAFSMYATSTNFAYFDVYLYVFTLISLILIIKGKWEWLIIPMAIVCMLIQHDFIFSHANLIFALLLYKTLLGDGKKRSKYLCIMALFLICVLGIYLYFEYVYVMDGASFANDLKALAKSLSENGESYSNIVMKSDILQEDMTEYIAEYRANNAIDLPTFCLLFSPYIFFGLRYFIKLILDKNTTLTKRLIYCVFLLGGLGSVPLFINDIYYGRYVFNVLFYYVALIIVLIAMGDTNVEEALSSLKADLKKITPFTFIWIIYPLFLLPFRAIAISNIIHKIAEMIFLVE